MTKVTVDYKSPPVEEGKRWWFGMNAMRSVFVVAALLCSILVIPEDGLPVQSMSDTIVTVILSCLLTNFISVIYIGVGLVLSAHFQTPRFSYKKSILDTSWQLLVSPWILYSALAFVMCVIYG